MAAKLISSLAVLILTSGLAQAQICNEILEDKTSTPARTIYSTIFSTDDGFFNTVVRYDDGPSPQANMSKADNTDQFLINNETNSILELKQKLTSRYQDKLIRVLDGQKQAVLTAAQEQFAMMLEELPTARPIEYSRKGDTLTHIKSGLKLSVRELAKEKSAETALLKVGRLIPEDLVLVKKDETSGEFRMIGGYLTFPTHWNVDSFMGATISQIHVNVGATPEKSAAFAGMINRILQRTLDTQQLVRRNNWFIETDPRYPLPNYLTVAYKGPAITRENYLDNVFVRAERQTLRGLTNSGVVVFAIQPMVYSLRSVMANPVMAQKLVNGIDLKFMGNNPSGFMQQLIQWLREDMPAAPAAI